jgi:hypothetical protein
MSARASIARHFGQWGLCDGPSASVVIGECGQHQLRCRRNVGLSWVSWHVNPRMSPPRVTSNSGEIPFVCERKL